MTLFRLFAIASASFLLAGPAAAQEPNTIVVGQAIDLSSPNASVGRDYVAGIKTYFDALNAAGGVNGKRIRYIVRDDQAQATVAAKVVTELIERDQIDFLLGGVGDSTAQAVLNTPAFQTPATWCCLHRWWIPSSSIAHACCSGVPAICRKYGTSCRTSANWE